MERPHTPRKKLLRVPEELAPNVGPGEGFDCDLCGKKFQKEYLLKAHKFGPFSKHKLNRDGSPTKSTPKAVKPDKVEPRGSALSKPALRKGPRRSGERVLGMVWSLASNVFVPRVSPRASMVMQWQSAAAGPALDELVAGTFIDKMIVQRIAGEGDRYRNATALLSLPLLVAVAENQPAIAAQPVFMEMARRAIRVNYEAILDAQIKEREEEARFEAKAEAAGLELYIQVNGERVNAIDALMGDIFGFTQAQPPVEQETVAA